MTKVLVFYGSYRRGRVGIRLANWLVEELGRQGAEAALVDAREVDLPMLDLRFSDYAEGEAPEAMARLSARIAGADACLFVAGEYNGGPQPGLKNLVDHYLPEWAGKPCGVITYSAGRFAGTKSGFGWGAITDKLGLVRIPGAPEVGQIQSCFDENSQPTGEDGARVVKQSTRYLAQLLRWAGAGAALRQQKP